MGVLSTFIQTSEVHVRDVDAAQRLAKNIYGNVLLTFPRRTKQVSWRLNSYSLGSVTVVAASQEQDGTMWSDSLVPHYVLGSVRRGAIEMVTAGESVTAVPDETAALLNPNTAGKATWRAGMLSRNVLIAPAALCAHLSALLGMEVHKAPLFKPVVSLRRGPTADVGGIVRLLDSICSRTEGPPASPHVLAHLREALFGALLSSVESTVSHLFQRAPATTSQRLARIAAEYLRAHASEPISLAQLAVHLGVGLRSLQRTFQATYKTSLRAFLTNSRLDLARRHLLSAEPGMTIAQVLYASGFGHPGEFSAAYRKRFGEKPSDTLRRSIGAHRTSLLLAASR